MGDPEQCLVIHLITVKIHIKIQKRHELFVGQQIRLTVQNGFSGFQGRRGFGMRRYAEGIFSSLKPICESLNLIAAIFKVLGKHNGSGNALSTA